LLPRFGDDVDRPVFQGLEGALRSFLDQTGTDNDRDGMLDHDFLQEGETIHARHFDVEGNDIGNLFGDAFGGYERIGRGGHHLNTGIAGEHVAESLANDGGIVDDEDANFAGTGWRIHMR
jgi:hypothetical protein